MFSSAFLILICCLVMSIILVRKIISGGKVTTVLHSCFIYAVAYLMIFNDCKYFIVRKNKCCHIVNHGGKKLNIGPFVGYRFQLGCLCYKLMGHAVSGALLQTVAFRRQVKTLR